MFDEDPADESYYDDMPGSQCARCRSTDVRWRQQGGKWVLFSLTPGQVHTCEIDASEFGAVPE
jgi:hypothetical protein